MDDAVPVESRRRNAETTRADILAAATRRFSQQGYDGVGLREIAADVGVDPALISRYFGGKEELFNAVLALSHDPADLFVGTVDSFCDDIANMVVFEPLADGKMDCILIMLHSSSSANARNTLLRFSHERFLKPLSEFIGGQDAMIRARTLGAVMMGGSISLMFPDAEEMTADDRTRLRDRIAKVLRSAAEI